MVKEDTYIPKKFFIRIITNNEVKMNEFFPFPFPNPKMALSLPQCSFVTNKLR